MTPIRTGSRIAPLTLVWSLSACAAVVSFDEYGTSSTPRAFRVAGVAQGLEGNKVTIALRDEKLVVEDGPFAFASGLVTGTPYEVTIVETPSTHSCTVERARGTVEDRDMDVALRCFSTNADLVSLVVDGAPLVPAFDRATLDYSAVLPSAGFLVSKSATATVSATAARTDARISIGASPPNAGTTSASIPLSATATPTDVVVTAPDGRTTKRYRMFVHERIADWVKGTASHEDTRFGSAVAVSGDRVVVGAPFEQPTDGGSRGAAYVYLRKDNELELETRLEVTVDGAYEVGESVAIAGDRIAIGSPRSGAHQSKEQGAVSLFHRAPTGWTASSAQTTLGYGYPGAHCGRAVALTTVWLANGCPDWQPSWAPPKSGGVVHVQGIAGTMGGPYGTIDPANEAPFGAFRAGEFGAAIALDGDTIAVGAPNNASGKTGVDDPSEPPSVEGSGAVLVYTWSAQSSSWQPQAFIKAPKNEPKSRFGHAVALSKDVLVIARTSVAEEVFVYRRSNAKWALEATLTAPNDAPHRRPRFGSSVAIADDLIAVGAPGDGSDAIGIDGDENNDRRGASGAVFLFRRSGGAWPKASYVKATMPFVNAFFGGAVALTPARLVVGSPTEAAKATGINPTPGAGFVRRSGAAYVY